MHDSTADVPDSARMTREKASQYAAIRRWAGRARALAAAYLAVLFVATHVPISAALAADAPNDKTVHLAAYALLTLIVLLGWELSVGRLEAKHYFAVWFAGTVYGIFDEVTQIPVGRTGDMHDWIADVVGILAGLLAFRFSRVWFYRIFVPDSPLAAWD